MKELKITEADRATVKKIADYDMEQLKHWKQELEYAQRQVALWTAKQDVSGALSLRLLLTAVALPDQGDA